MAKPTPIPYTPKPDNIIYFRKGHRIIQPIPCRWWMPKYKYLKSINADTIIINVNVEKIEE